MDAASLGMSPTAIGLGNGWPELPSLLLSLYRDKVQKLAFVPSYWALEVEKLMRDGTGTIWVPTPTKLGNGATIAPNAATPDWLKHPQAREIWQDIFKASQLVVSKYAQNKADEGKAELQAAYRNAAFWDAAYTSAKFVADLPKNVVKATVETATGITDAALGAFWKSGTGKVLIGVAIVAGIAAVYFIVIPKMKLAGKVLK